MDHMSSFVNLLTVVKNQVGDKAFEKAQYALGDALGNNFRIPIETFTDDKKSQQIMKEFGLDKPENMIRFMVESFYGALEAIQSEVILLKLMQINGPIGMIQSAKRMYDYGVENPNDKVNKFNTAQDDLFRAVEILKRQVSTCIDSTRTIDSKPRWKFFINAKEHMATIDSNISIIRLSLNAIEQAVSMQMLIADKMGKNIEKSVLRPYEEFYDTVLLSGDTCILLQGYEFKDKEKEKYFLRLSEKKKNIKMLDTTYEEYVDEYADELEGYDNIVF